VISLILGCRVYASIRYLAKLIHVVRVYLDERVRYL